MDMTFLSLQEIGLSNNVVNSICDQADTIFDLIITEKSNEILSSTNRKSNILKAISKAEDNLEWFTPLLFESPFILLGFGASKTALTKIVDAFNLTTIKVLINLSDEEIKRGMKRSFSSAMNKIRLAAKNYEDLLMKDEHQQRIKKNMVLFYFYSVREVQDKDVAYQVKEYIDEYFPSLKISEIEIDQMNKMLIESGYLYYHDDTYYFPTNIYYQSRYDSIEKPEPVVTLKEILAEDFKDMALLKHRLNGLTLEEIGNRFGISKERVRQRQARVLKSLGKVAEIEKYRKIFENYSFNKDGFISLFHEPPQVFELLDLFLKKGTEDPSYYVLESKDIPNSDKFKFLMKQRFFVTRFGELKQINKVDFAEEILFSHKSESYTPETFFQLYNSEASKYPELDLEVTSPRAIEGCISRSYYVISTRGHRFRYYDYNLSDEDIKLLNNKVDFLNKGCYSMLKLFNEDKEFMEQLDIRDEYELHNLYKRMREITSNKILLTRSPEFTVGDIKKKDFIMEEIRSFSDQKIEVCLKYLFEEYGFKENTMSSYISMNYKSYINDGIICAPLNDLDNELLENLKLYFLEDVYMKQDVLVILQEFGHTISSPLLGKLGYYITGNVVFKKEFGNVTNAFSSFVMKDAQYRRTNDSIGQSREMTSYLFKKETERKLVVLEKGLYVSTDFLEERGISPSFLDDFVNKVYNFLPKTKYFTLFSLEQLGFKHPLLDLGFESIFYERLMVTSNRFNSVTRKSPILFVKGKTIPATLELFYSDQLADFEIGVDVHDFVYDLNSEFGIDFNLDTIIIGLKRYGCFHSKELNKLYFDKDTYLNEVYGQ
ncbi:sigma factor-like helix-turn-helix DNA-binding protein [Amphibacillus sp. Q70]|uniref:sigma factor-like helix-turn-helix DNA-binding protein n=1 Tax=Amphibacillus sp. Q70 TaxID=3453416 RepID=UPI003F8790C3